MTLLRTTWVRLGFCLMLLCAVGQLRAAHAEVHSDFPLALSSYTHAPEASLWQILVERVQTEPFNLVATIIFALAIVHTFLAPMFLRLSHRIQARHEASRSAGGGDQEDSVSILAGVLHFFGEVEAVFGIWAVPLLMLLSSSKGWHTARDYAGGTVDFTEATFVVVIMAMAASRPVLSLAEQLMHAVAQLGRGSPAAWWVSILTIGPLLGSLITEPAAMTISALLLGKRFYELRPSNAFAYATLGLLFVNVSVGGTLTHFAAPPVLMVANKWGWGFTHMALHFGWKAAVGILTANMMYLLAFRREFQAMAAKAVGVVQGNQEIPRRPVPFWITCVHIFFLAWTVINNHTPALFVGGFLFYLAFTSATESHQEELNLRPALLVGFFLAGLVVHGGLQGWWLGPVLRKLNELPLFLGAVGLTAFNDNAAITYLASLVPDFPPEMKYMVVAGAVVGGGLTVIANAPNPAGQSVLAKYFPDGVSPLRLLLGALPATAIVGLYYLLLR